jgi:hypothetical protein
MYPNPTYHFVYDSTLSGTGEHGVGIGKKEYLEAELGKGTVQIMKSIKKTIDPLNIMNPGKVSYSSYLVEYDSNKYYIALS